MRFGLDIWSKFWLKLRAELCIARSEAVPTSANAWLYAVAFVESVAAADAWLLAGPGSLSRLSLEV
jgi:hypothetical protein